MRCFYLCKNKPIYNIDIRITDYDPSGGPRTGEWKTVQICTRHYNDLRTKMLYHQDETGQIRGYTEARYNDELIQVVEYGSSWPITTAKGKLLDARLS